MWNGKAAIRRLGNIDSDGLFTPSAKGTTTIRAKAATESYKATAEAEVEVVAPVLDNDLHSLLPQRIFPFGRHSGSQLLLWISTKTVFRASASSGQATMKTSGTIDQNGLFTPLAEGTANITASAEGVMSSSSRNNSSPYCP